MRIVFCGTGAFGAPSLRALVDSRIRRPARRHAARPAGRPLARAARSRSSARAGARAARRAAGAALGSGALEVLRAAAPDAAVVVSYGQILRQAVLDLPRLGCLNVHGSLLPRHRGASPIQSAILAGDATTGVTVIRMDEGVDTGPVVAPASEPIRPRDTYADAARPARRARRDADRAARSAARGRDRSSPTPQDGALATRCRILRKEDGRLDWSRTRGRARPRDPRAESVAGDVRNARRARRALRSTSRSSRPSRPRRRSDGVRPASWSRAEGADSSSRAARARSRSAASGPPARKAMDDRPSFLRGYGIAAGDAFRSRRSERSRREGGPRARRGARPPACRRRSGASSATTAGRVPPRRRASASSSPASAGICSRSTPSSSATSRRASRASSRGCSRRCASASSSSSTSGGAARPLVVASTVALAGTVGEEARVPERRAPQDRDRAHLEPRPAVRRGASATA